MTGLELIFSMPGEASTTVIVKNRIQKDLCKIKKQLSKVELLKVMQDENLKAEQGKK